MSTLCRIKWSNVCTVDAGAAPAEPPSQHAACLHLSHLCLHTFTVHQPPFVIQVTALVLYVGPCARYLFIILATLFHKVYTCNCQTVRPIIVFSIRARFGYVCMREHVHIQDGIHAYIGTMTLVVISHRQQTMQNIGLFTLPKPSGEQQHSSVPAGQRWNSTLSG